MTKIIGNLTKLMNMDKQNKKTISGMGASLSSLSQNKAEPKPIKREKGLSQMGVSLSSLMRNASRAQILEYALIKVKGNAAFWKTLAKQDKENN